MRPSRSLFVDVRGLRYHCRSWGDPSRPKLVMLHGWMDVSASFQFLVDALEHERYVLAPDWRGYGETGWAGADSYWFPDYLGDLDALLQHFSPDGPVDLLGHSMGGNVACLYAGVRPERVRRLVNLEGFGLRPTVAEEAPARYRAWLDELREPERFRDYASFEELAARLRGANGRLTAERALFLARHWGIETTAGRVALRSDPAHKRVNPVLYRFDEARACWKAITAPVLWVDGAESETLKYLRIDGDDYESRKGHFRHLVARTIPDAGHMLHHDQPEAVARAVEEFLAD
jgi:pimeloyl-ACP methyl ester carboxylesterase